MKSQTILLTLFLFISPVQSQEEIFFNSLNTSDGDMKISESVSGIDFNLDYTRILPGRYMGYEMGSIETHLNYFHESRIANTWSLFKSVGFGNAAYYGFEVLNGLPGEYSTNNYRYHYELSMNVIIEPRWYFAFKSRFKQHKDLRNNSGWYFSLPLTCSATILHEPVTGITSSWIPERLVMKLIAPPTIGYRNSFADNWFFEFSMGYIPYHLWFSEGAFTGKAANKIGLFSADSFNSEVKIALTF